MSFTRAIVPTTIKAGIHSHLSKLMTLKKKMNTTIKMSIKRYPIISLQPEVTLTCFINKGSKRASSTPIPKGSMPPTRL